MRSVYAIATNITSALGLDTAAHWKAVCNSITGLREHNDITYSNAPFWASKLDAGQWQIIQSGTAGTLSLTPFEQLATFSAKQAIENCEHELVPGDTVVVLSTTKGNIELLAQMPDERMQLQTSADRIAAALGYNAVKPHVVSQACVSGVLSLTYAMRMLQAGRYKHAIVIGCDRFSKFVLSGFQSFHAIAGEACRPFDAARKGINLGEAGATIILSAETVQEPMARLLSGASSNDANHISGPSRTGEELALAIQAALKEAGIMPEQVDMISAHGTATKYNDEMEAKALNLCGLQDTPVHSIKGYTGHTLGAAGVLESALIIESIRHRQLVPSPGFRETGVTEPINVTTQMLPADLQYVLKTASGFGGCNATAVWGRM